MKFTLNISDELVENAIKLTGISDVSDLVNYGLRILIQNESSKKLSELGGSEKELKDITRRRI